MITSDELQTIVNAVMSSLHRQAKTIQQLPTAENVGKTDVLEIGSGKKCSFSTILTDLFRPWAGTQAEYNALGAYDDDRWYVVVDPVDFHAVALFRGDRLITAEPNMVGQFAEGTTPYDWYWWPNGVKTPIPVDPATKRFSYYWPGVMTDSRLLFAGGFSDDWEDHLHDIAPLVRVEKLPPLGNAYYALSALRECEVVPVVDCRNIKNVPGSPLEYVLMGTTTIKGLWFANTQEVKTWKMVINTHTSPSFKRIMGIDFTGTVNTTGAPFSKNGPACIEIANLGKCPEATSFDLTNDNWGDGYLDPLAYSSLISSLAIDSFDRAKAGYPTATVILSQSVYNRLGTPDRYQIAGKGYTIVLADS